MTTENQAPEGGQMPPLPPPTVYSERADEYVHFTDDQMRYYGDACARAALAAQPQAAPAGLSEAHRQELIMLRSRVRTQRDELAKLKKAFPSPAEGDGLRPEAVTGIFEQATRQWLKTPQPQPAKGAEKNNTEPLPHVIAERDEYASELARCRDAFPIPEAGTPLDGPWQMAMGDPLAVADYVTAALAANVQPKGTVPEHLPTKEHIRELAQEAMNQVMEQAQVFASAWSLVGGPFDSGCALDDANDAKDELRTMVRSLADLAAETVRPIPSPAVQDGALSKLLAHHAALLEDNSYAYFELAYTRSTGWMAWITDKPAKGEPGTAEYARSRKVIARGQGDTPEEAAADALDALESKPPVQHKEQP